MDFPNVKVPSMKFDHLKKFEISQWEAHRGNSYMHQHLLPAKYFTLQSYLILPTTLCDGNNYHHFIHEEI